MSEHEEKLQSYQKTVAIALAILVLLLAFLIVRPFLLAIMSSAILSYLFYPFYKKLTKLLPPFAMRESVSAWITCLIIVIMVLVPMILVTAVISQEIRQGYFFLQNIFASPEFKINLPPLISAQLGDLSQYKQPMIGMGTQFIGWLQSFIKGIPNVILNIFATIFSIYFMLKEAKNIHGFVLKFLPLPEGRYSQIFARFDNLSRGMVVGQIVVGLVQGILAGIGFMALGVPNPVLWGLMTAIVSIIPMLGAALVWVPIAIFLFMADSSNGFAWRGLALLIYGTFVISFIDNILKPKIIGDHARVHPLIILFGILGGIELMGLPGILIGPMILTICDLVLEIYHEVM